MTTDPIDLTSPVPIIANKQSNVLIQVNDLARESIRFSVRESPTSRARFEPASFPPRATFECTYTSTPESSRANQRRPRSAEVWTKCSQLPVPPNRPPLPPLSSRTDSAASANLGPRENRSSSTHHPFLPPQRPITYTDRCCSGSWRFSPKEPSRNTPTPSPASP